MPSNKVACPHCGHDGTIASSRPPLGSHGFNYLGEGVISPKEESPDERRRIQLQGEVQGESSDGAGATLECRSCWRIFPIPEGLQWAVAPLSAHESESGGAAVQPDFPGPGKMETAAGAITRSLLVLLRNMMEEAEQASELRVAKLDADLTALNEQASSAAMAQEMWLGRIAAVESAVRLQQANYKEIMERAAVWAGQHQEMLQKLDIQDSTIARVEERNAESRQAAAAGLDELTARVTSLDSLSERVGAIGENLRTEKETVEQVRATCTQLQAENEELRRRLDSQASVIRALHSSAIEQNARREELRAAVQRLEELTASTNLVQPLPEQL